MSQKPTMKYRKKNDCQICLKENIEIVDLDDDGHWAYKNVIGICRDCLKKALKLLEQE